MDIRYAAGLMDGDGSFFAAIRKIGAGGDVEVRVTLTQHTPHNILYRFQDRFGGQLNKCHWKNAFEWRLMAKKDVKLFIEKVLPHLHVKALPAAACLKILDLPLHSERKLKLTQQLSAYNKAH